MYIILNSVSNFFSNQLTNNFRCPNGRKLILWIMDYDFGNSSDFPGMYSADNNKKNNDSDCKNFNISTLLLFYLLKRKSFI